MLLSTNIGSRYLRQSNQFLLLGSCMLEEYPQLVEKYARNRVCLHVCLETHHMNMAETKLACMINIHQPKELLILTVDGSPHCLQLHILADDLHRYFKAKLAIRHLVVERGKVYEINARAVKTARHLHKVNQLLSRQRALKS